jgi:hypothetical protein
MAKYNTKAQAEKQLKDVLSKYPSVKKEKKDKRGAMFYLLKGRGVDTNQAIIVADNWARKGNDNQPRSKKRRLEDTWGI